MTGIEGEFETVVRRWSGEAAWYLATLPLDLADDDPVTMHVAVLG